MLQENSQKRYAQKLALESIVRIIGSFTSFSDASFTLLDKDARILFPPKHAGNEDFRDYKDIVEQASKFDEMFFNGDEGVCPIRISGDFAGVLHIYPVKDQDRIVQWMRLTDHYIQEIAVRSFELANTIDRLLKIQDELTILYKYIEKIGEQKDVKALANNILNDVSEKFKPKHACIFMSSEENETLIPTASYPENNPLFRNVKINKKGIIYKIFQSQLPEIINDLKKEDLNEDFKCSCLSGMTVDKLLAVPFAHNQVRGIVCVFDKENNEDFYAGDQDFLFTLAGPASVAIDNVGLNRRLKKRLEQEAWKEISFRAAHKIGNILFGLRGDIDWLKIILDEKPLDEKGIESAIQETKESLNEANSIVREFKGYVRPDELRLEIADINRVLEHAISKTEKAAGEEICFKTEYSENLMPLELDMVRIKQCIQELIENACRFMDYKGEITVCSGISSDEDKQKAGIFSEEDFISVMVKNTGKGVKPENKVKIFYPFFSTSAKGSGMGLPIVKQYVEKHGGRIMEVGEYDKGAEFLIILPVRSDDDKND